MLLYANESEALTHPYLAHAWARRGADLRVPAPGQTKKVATMGALDWAKRKLIVATSRTKRSADFIALLEALDRSHGPKLGFKTKPAVIVLDNGPIHASKAALAGLAARSHWLAVEWLPKYAPELNEIENVWRDLKTNHLAHQTFTDADVIKPMPAAPGVAYPLPIDAVGRCPLEDSGGPPAYMDLIEALHDPSHPRH